ncbi:MAG: hypothetical protein ACE5D7_10215 [Fidelibacterota bacterium]
MASIAQKKLFGWKEVDRLGDLDRLRLVIVLNFSLHLKTPVVKGCCLD